ncbi:dethiobiotin synthase [Veronia pacifica]|uniref:ATP-dependent dethiobiotin synthetase BioD n=1 Tax=Veronia pacifica TaxID=1080227 RepID=A0A1C3EPW9_9GAMM|nr:dethiobiotin synthase [Veronia pacifica]ODA35266.1 dethiobiotin synthase [Veronia pacifica]
MSNAFFVTGTDTEVGKTFSSVALIEALKQKNVNVAGYKPVAAGSESSSDGICNPDAVALRATSNVDMTYEECNPCLLATPCSPHIAARIETSPVLPSLLSDGLERLKAKSDIVIVEGAGGWHVPLSDNYLFSQWVKQEQLPVIMVVGIKLGCLNHALLTARAIRDDGLKLVGWIANCVDPQAQFVEENIDTLRERLNTPFLGALPYQTDAAESQQGMSNHLIVDELLAIHLCKVTV